MLDSDGGGSGDVVLLSCLSQINELVRIFNTRYSLTYRSRSQIISLTQLWLG